MNIEVHAGLMICLHLVHGPDNHEIVQKVQYKIPVDCFAKITSLSDEVISDKSIISSSSDLPVFSNDFSLLSIH